MRNRTTISAIGFTLAALTAQTALGPVCNPAMAAEARGPRVFRSKSPSAAMTAVSDAGLSFGTIPPGHWAFDELSRLTGDPEISEYLNRRKSSEKGVLKYNFAVIIAKFLTQSNNTEPAEVIKTLGPDRLMALKRLVPLVREELANLDMDTAAIDSAVDAVVETGTAGAAEPGRPGIHATGPAGGIAVLAARKGLYSDISTIKITPNLLKLKAGESKLMKAFGITMDNKIRPMRAVWELKGQVGELGPDGAFRATRAGSGVIRVYIPGTSLESSAMVQVLPGELAKVVIRPGDGTLKPGQSIDFSALGADSFGNEVPLEAVWKCVGKAGKMVGSTLVAMTEGQVKVYASTADGKAFDVAVVDVAAGQAPRPGIELKEIEELKKAAAEANAPALARAGSGASSREPAAGQVATTRIAGQAATARIAGHAAITRIAGHAAITPASDQAAPPRVIGQSALPTAGQMLPTGSPQAPAAIEADRARLSEDLKRLKAKIMANRTRLSTILGENQNRDQAVEGTGPRGYAASGTEATEKGEPSVGAEGEPAVNAKTHALIAAVNGAGLGTTPGGWKYSVTPVKPKSDSGRAMNPSEQPVPGNMAPSVLISKDKGKDGLEVRMFSLKNTTPEEIASAIDSGVFGDPTGMRHQVDGRTNSMVISARGEVLQTISKYIEMADVPTPQVRIEARIIEVTLTENEGMGVDWSMLLPSKGAAKPVAEENSISVPLPGPSGEGATKLRFGTLSQEQFTAMLSVISARDRVKLVSNPSITTLNRKLASILVGQVVPIARFSMNDYNGNYEVIGYDEKKIGINLEVTPSITSGGTINLKVVPKVEDILGYVGQFKERPVTFTRSAETEVAIRDNETLVIGGLIRETREKKISKVPFLGDIPGIRTLFRRTLDTREKKETIIFITPRMVERETGRRI